MGSRSFAKGISHTLIESLQPLPKKKATTKRKAKLQEGDKGSQLELDLLSSIRTAGLPEPERELMLVPGRRFRSDFIWADQMLIVETEGGTWSGGRHTRGGGFESDCVKYNLLALAGWKVIRVTRKHVDSGEAIQWIKEGLKE